MLHDIPHIGAVKEKQLILLLIVQMVRIGQSEKEKDRHTKQQRE